MVQADWDICLVAGARPNFIKIAPILRAISERWQEVWKHSLLGDLHGSL